MRYRIAREGVHTILGTFFEENSIKWDDDKEYVVTWSNNFSNPEMVMGKATRLQYDEDGWITADIEWNENATTLAAMVNKDFFLTIYGNQVEETKGAKGTRLVHSVTLKAIYCAIDQNNPWDEVH